MSFRLATYVLLSTLVSVAEASGHDVQPVAGAAYSQKVRVSGVVRDESNAITLPGLPVEVVGTGETVYTDVDGRYVLDLAPGRHQLRVTMEGYQERLVTIDVAPASRGLTTDVALSMSKF